jgi:hypothetical protein
MPTQSVQSVRERILQAVLLRLQPIATAHQATLHRSPTVAITREQSPALVVFADGDAIVERANDRATRELSIRLIALARSETPQNFFNDPAQMQALVSSTAPSVADRLLVAAHAALFADVNFDGLALGLKEVEADWEIEDAEAVVCAVPTRYAITYRSLLHDLSAVG